MVSPLNHLNLGLCVEGRGFDKGKALPLTVVSARSREGAVAQTSPYISKEYVSITKDQRTEGGRSPRRVMHSSLMPAGGPSVSF